MEGYRMHTYESRFGLAFGRVDYFVSNIFFYLAFYYLAKTKHGMEDSERHVK